MIYTGLLEHVVVKKLYRWIRHQSQPHGTTDHFYRGRRMSYNWAYRVVVCFVSLVMFSLAGAGVLVDALLHDKSWWSLFISASANLMAIMGALVPFQAFREFAVVTDEGLLKRFMFGSIQQLAWNEILGFKINPAENKVTLSGTGKSKMTMSLAYDGWQDFLEMAKRRMDPGNYQSIAYALANVDAKPVPVLLRANHSGKSLSSPNVRSEPM